MNHLEALRLHKDSEIIFCEEHVSVKETYDGFEKGDLVCTICGKEKDVGTSKNSNAAPIQLELKNSK